ncbi:hypothetical protein [Bifidobacterium oedipodis]|nr:hypothetical protein [Bifidobacterium sp. DSM 109957]
MDFRYALPIAISAARKGVRFEDVMDVCVRMRRGSRRICTLMRYANAATENGGEAFALGTMLEEGIPMPRLQQGFTDPQTGRQYWADFVWRLDNGRVVVGEYDGMLKYVDADMTAGKSIRGVVNDERARESAIIRAGASDVVRFGFNDVLNRTPLLVKLFEKGVLRSGARIAQIW